MNQRKRLCFEIIEHDNGRVTVTEPGENRSANGETAHEAIIQYVEQARDDQREEVTA